MASLNISNLSKQKTIVNWSQAQIIIGGTNGGTRGCIPPKFDKNWSPQEVENKISMQLSY